MDVYEAKFYFALLPVIGATSRVYMSHLWSSIQLLVILVDLSSRFRMWEPPLGLVGAPTLSSGPVSWHASSKFMLDGVFVLQDLVTSKQMISNCGILEGLFKLVLQAHGLALSLQPAVNQPSLFNDWGMTQLLNLAAKD
ncbi:hypothetical protein Ancab_001004 [Ancistrocladus abbreviatus]